MGPISLPFRARHDCRSFYYRQDHRREEHSSLRNSKERHANGKSQVHNPIPSIHHSTLIIAALAQSQIQAWPLPIRPLQSRIPLSRLRNQRPPRTLECANRQHLRLRSISLRPLRSRPILPLYALDLTVAPPHHARRVL